MKHANIILVVLLILVTFNLTAQVTVNVTNFGATGNGITDDRAAIQNAIDHVNNNGGGTVFFPSGTYIISPVPDPNPAQVICLKLHDNIKLEGASRDSSIIKLQNNAPNFDAMIGNNPSYQKIDSIQLKNLCFDANGANNPVASPSVLSNGSRSIFRIFLGENYIIENCRFTNHKGVWCIVFNGLTENIIIRNNEFTNIGDDNVEWDHSSIYTNGDNFLIENNYFQTLSGPGTKAARAAIEIHGSNQIVRNNMIVAYPYGINVTGYSVLYPSFNQTYHNNVFLDVMNGFVLWSSASSNPSASNGLNNIKIFDNTIKVNSLGWQNYDFYDGGAGIVFERNRDLDIDSLYIFENEIEFVGNPINAAAKSRYSNGIAMGNNNYNGVNVLNTYILNNTIKNSNGPGMNFDFKFTNSVIVGNTIENAGNSLANLFTGFRCGIYVGDTISDVQMNCNELRKTNASSNLNHALYNNGNLLSNSYFFDNSQIGYTMPNISNGTYASGLNWIQTPNKPLVKFQTDSLGISNGQTAQIQISLDAPAANPLTVRLIPIDRYGKYPNGWQTDTVVVFNIGEQTKPITITNLSANNTVNYLLIKQSNDYLIDCNALLKINLNTVTSVNQTINVRKEIKIYPNPTQDYFVINTQSNEPYQLEIININGQIIVHRTISSNEKIPIDNLSKGIYIVRVYNESKTFINTHKLIIN